MNFHHILAGLAILTLLVPSAALGHHHEKHGDHRQHMERMAGHLELSDNQKEQWRAIHETHHPRMREIHSEMREQRHALREASTDGFDEAAAERAAERLGELTAQASLMRARMHAEVREILTEEQRTRLDEQREKRGKQGYGKRHKGESGRQGRRD